MEAEHPIPQQISAYQFRLVGDMTIKQFFQVAAGALIALLIYSMAIPYYVKWPLVLISFLSGVAFALRAGGVAARLGFGERPGGV